MRPEGRFWVGFGLRRSGSHLCGNYLLSGAGGKITDLRCDREGDMNRGPVTKTAVIGDGPDHVFVIDFDYRMESMRWIEDLSDMPLYLHLRSAYNWIASRLGTSDRLAADPPYGFRPWNTAEWKLHARWALEGKGKVLLYDKLLADPDYLRRMSFLFGVEMKNISGTQCQAGGFETVKKGETRTNPLDGNERYKRYLDDPRMKPVLDDPEIAALNHELFGWSA
jgi:hypothetical protein